MRLSLAMIIKNEARHLAHCLESVRPLVDEIIVMDTGSTDESVAIAQALGAQVHSFAWVDDFSAARNAALAKCTGDWILVMDADEAIDVLDHAKIRKALETPEMQGYYLWLRDYFTSGALIGLSGAVQPNDSLYAEGRPYSHQCSYELVRLFRNQKADVFQGRIHEVAESYFLERGLPLGHLDAVIHHYGKVDLDQDRAKQKGYTDLAKREAQARPKDAMAHFNVVQQALLVEDWKAVLASSQAYLKLEKKVPMMIYLGASKALLALKRPSEALPYLDIMLKQKPNHAVALCMKGDCLDALKKHEEAQKVYLQAMEAEPNFTLPFLNFSRMLERLQQHDFSRKVLEAGLDQNPLDEVLWGELIAQAGKHWPAQAIQDAWDALQSVPTGGKGIWHKLVITTLLGQGHTTEARAILERAKTAFPNDTDWKTLDAKCGGLTP